MFYINLKYWQKSVCFKLLQGVWAANFLFLWSYISGITSTLFFPSKINTSQNILQLQKVEQISSKWSFTKCALIGGKKTLLLIWNLTNWCDYIFILTVLWRLLYLWYRKLQEKNLQHIAQICGKKDKVHWNPTVIQDQERKFQLKRLNRRNKYYFTARLIKLLL